MRVDKHNPQWTHAVSLGSARILRRITGFTLIELVVATVIAAILMGGILVVVSQLTRDQRRLIHSENCVNEELVVELLRKDLLCSTRLIAQPKNGAIVMEGYCGLNPTSLMPTGRAVRIQYRLAQTESGPWLVREQTQLDEEAPGPWREYVSPAIKTFSVSQELWAKSKGPTTPRRSSTQPAEDRSFMPDRVWMRVEWVDQARTPLEREIVLR